MTTSHEKYRINAEALDSLPDDGRQYELIVGRLVSEPPAGARHGRIALRMGILLNEFLKQQQRLGVLIGNDCGFILARSPDTVRAPDVAFVTMARFEEVGDTLAYFPGAPDLAIEVRSPGDREGDVHSKVADYLAAGTRSIWILDPTDSSVTVYQGGLSSLLAPKILGPDDTLDGGEVLPGFSIQVQRIFDLP